MVVRTPPKVELNSATFSNYQLCGFTSTIERRHLQRLEDLVSEPAHYFHNLRLAKMKWKVFSK